MATAPDLRFDDLAQPIVGEADSGFNFEVAKSDWRSAADVGLLVGQFNASIRRQHISRQPKAAVIDDKQRVRTGSASSVSQNRAEASPLIDIPNLFARRQIENRSVNTLQEWEGLVEEIEGDSFVARLRDLTSGDRSEELATIPLTEVDPKDRDRVVPGALFHLFVGFTRRSGSRRRETFTYFRKHLPSTKEATSQLADLLSAFDE